MNRIIARGVCAACGLGLGVILSAPAVVSAGPKLNTTSETLLIGKTKTINLSGVGKSKVRWSSSKNSVLTVKNGKITAKKAGNSTITASYKGKKYKCRVTVKNWPQYKGKPYTVINSNKPEFTKKQKKSTKAFEKYSKLDTLGRCGVAYANICKQIMPTEERGAIGMIRPSGWHTVKYSGIVDGNYLYNICKEHCMFILHLT